MIARIYKEHIPRSEKKELESQSRTDGCVLVAGTRLACDRGRGGLGYPKEPPAHPIIAATPSVVAGRDDRALIFERFAQRWFVLSVHFNRFWPVTVIDPSVNVKPAAASGSGSGGGGVSKQGGAAVGKDITLSVLPKFVRFWPVPPNS